MMLSRTVRADDIHIVGDFDPQQIRADPEAKEETDRLNEIVLRREAFEKDLHDSSTVIGSLNVRSLRKHLEDVLTDPFIKKCDILDSVKLGYMTMRLPNFQATMESL